MSGYIQSNQIVLVPNIAAYAVSVADTGKTLITSLTTALIGDIVISLPPLSEGLHYRFINGGSAVAATNVQTVTIRATAAVLYGQIIEGPVINVAFTPVSALTDINFVALVTLKGDCIDLYCDGASWYVDGRARSAGSITAA